MAKKEPARKPVAQIFNAKILDRTVVAIPLLRAIADTEEVAEWMRQHRSFAVKNYNAVIFLARDYPERAAGALQQIEQLLEQILGELGRLAKNNRLLQGLPKDRDKRSFVVAQLERPVRLALVDRDRREHFKAIDRLRPTHFDVIIDVNLNYPLGRAAARAQLVRMLDEILPPLTSGSEAQRKEKADGDGQYVFARMRKEHIDALLQKDTTQSMELATKLNYERQGSPNPANDVKPETCRVIHSMWPDFPIKPCITQSIATVKADAALNSFSTVGGGITWAVIDSGIDATHPHFSQSNNINPNSPLHRNFTDGASPNPPEALRDVFGHGTHVAGIIAGGFDRDRDPAKNILRAVRRVRVKPTAQESDVEKVESEITLIRGMAPKCELVSLKVLDDVGFGEVSNVIAALSYILDVNNSGRAELKIHGVNISLGYEIEPEWFACGESPICIEVNRVVRSGVVVVVAAGNTGHGTVTSSERSTSAGLDMTINDPGNADLAITVGSTHRDMPHRYGISFFSSKGPTGDGRPKPDLVAPGEKILSCATGSLLRDRAGDGQAGRIHYVEDSGTSMATPHVSGIIAGFLSVRREFIGKPEQVKGIFCATATDLKRDRYFQGAGLVDLMRAIQSV
ncbi:MAG: S8 family peptidase [Chthoniobacter sp.]|uniref:S8 family peptidase n=1 Tax=Chthoniobacter sp. TaxID=2510640 RepID=UPI0032A7B31F